MPIPRLTAEATLYRTSTSYAGYAGAHMPTGRRAVVPQQTALAAPPPPDPGCWFVGTACRGFYQTCKYCCGDGAHYSQRCGWCVGWWNAPSCPFD